MKVLFIILMGILALNALVILAVGGILVVDHLRTRRKEPNDDAPAKAS